MFNPFLFLRHGYQEQKPSYSVSLDESDCIKDVRWTRKAEKAYLILSSTRKLYHGFDQGSLKCVMVNVDAGRPFHDLKYASFSCLILCLLHLTKCSYIWVFSGSGRNFLILFEYLDLQTIYLRIYSVICI